MSWPVRAGWGDELPGAGARAAGVAGRVLRGVFAQRTQRHADIFRGGLVGQGGNRHLRLSAFTSRSQAGKGLPSAESVIAYYAQERRRGRAITYWRRGRRALTSPRSRGEVATEGQRPSDS